MLSGGHLTLDWLGPVSPSECPHRPVVPAEAAQTAACVLRTARHGHDHSCHWRPCHVSCCPGKEITLLTFLCKFGFKLLIHAQFWGYSSFLSYFFTHYLLRAAAIERDRLHLSNNLFVPQRRPWLVHRAAGHILGRILGIMLRTRQLGHISGNTQHLQPYFQWAKVRVCLKEFNSILAFFLRVRVPVPVVST